MSESAPSRREWSLWIGLGVLLLATRFVDLGRQTPWLDEVTNWIYATEYGLRPRISTHMLSWWFQGLGVCISDSSWGLRLPSAVFGSLAAVTASVWARTRFGRLHALCVGGLLALSPFSIFYSQDANHYAPILLEGVLAAVTIDWLLERNKPHYVLASLSGLFCLIAFKFHPVGAFCFGGFFLAMWFWKIARADRLPMFQCSVPTRRKILGLGGVLMIGLVLGHVLYHHSRALFRASPATGREFGLNAEFWRCLLADFFGAIYHHQPIDTTIGIVGTLLSAAGWILAARRGRPWAAIAASCVVIGVFGPFFVIRLAQYFSPRYLTAAVPVLLMGTGLFLAEAMIACRHSSRTWRLAGVIAAVWVAAFVGRATWWKATQLGGEFQPTGQALAWIRQHTEPNALVLTRHRYSSRSFRFLWDRADMGDRQHVPLSFLPASAAPSIQQAEELAWEGRPVYFLSLIESEEWRDATFKVWIEENSTVAKQFPSNAPDDFVPIDWGITIRRIGVPVSDPLALPRAGERTSALYGERMMAREGPVLHNHSAAAYRLRPHHAHTLSIAYRWLDRPSPERPGWIIVSLNGEFPVVWETASLDEQGVLLYPLPEMLPEIVTLTIQPADPTGRLRRNGARLVIREISASLESDAIAGGHWPNRYRSWPDGTQFGSPIETQLIGGKLNPQPPASTWVVPGTDSPLLVMWRVRLDGLGDYGLRVRVKTEGSRNKSVGLAAWTFDTIAMGAVVPGLTGEELLTHQFDVVPYSSRRVWNPYAKLTQPLLFVAEPQSQATGGLMPH